MPNTIAAHHGRLPWPEGAPRCLDLQALEATSGSPSHLLPALKAALAGADRALAEAFWGGAPVDILVQARAWVVEQVLLVAWGDARVVDLPSSGGLVRVDAPEGVHIIDHVTRTR